MHRCQRETGLDEGARSTTSQQVSLACLDAGRRNETQESETKAGYRSGSGSQSVVAFPPAPSATVPVRQCKEGQVIPVHTGRVCYKTGILSLGT